MADRPGRTLTARAVLVTCAVALVSVLVTAMVAVPVAVRAAERRDRQALAAQAQVAPSCCGRARPVRELAGERLIRQLGNQGTTIFLISGGEVDRAGLPPQVVNRVSNGRNVSGRRLVDGQRALVEGRALPGGDGVVLTRPLGAGVWRQVLRGLWLPLLAGMVAGAVAGPGCEPATAPSGCRSSRRPRWPTWRTR